MNAKFSYILSNISTIFDLNNNAQNPMKLFAFSAILFLLTIITSCSDTDPEILEINDITYPLKNQKNEFNWEEEPIYEICEDYKMTLPWYDGTAGMLDYYISDDYTKRQGWTMLFNTLNDKTDCNQNYLIFYNKFTGVIRVFYYLLNNVDGDSGFFKLWFSDFNALLNNEEYFAQPITSEILSKSAKYSNLSHFLYSWIGKGWNAFDVEITYDPTVPNKELYFSIGGLKHNKQSINYTSDWFKILPHLELSALYNNIKHPPNNQFPIQETFDVSLAGRGADLWLKNMVSENQINHIPNHPPQAILDGGPKALIASGLHKIFGSYTSNLNATSYNILRFKTDDQYTSTEAIIMDSESVSPLVKFPFPGSLIPDKTIPEKKPIYNKPLGVWNIDKTPVVLQSKRAYLAGENGNTYYYNRMIRLDDESFKIVLNPEIFNHISHYETEVELYYYKKFRGKADWNDKVFNKESEKPFNSSVVYKNEAASGNINTEIHKLNKDKKGVYEQIVNSAAPNFPENYENTNQKQPTELPYLYYDVVNDNFVVKVTVILYPNDSYNQDPFVMTRSYVPDYQLVDE